MLARVHNITVRRVDVLTEIRILALEGFKFGLEHFLITRLLFDLFLEVLAEIPDAVFHHVLALLHFLDAKLKLLVEGVEVGAVLDLATVRGDDLVVDVIRAFDRRNSSCCLGERRLCLLNDASGAGIARTMPDRSLLVPLRSDMVLFTRRSLAVGRLVRLLMVVTSVVVLSQGRAR